MASRGAERGDNLIISSRLLLAGPHPTKSHKPQSDKHFKFIFKLEHKKLQMTAG